MYQYKAEIIADMIKEKLQEDTQHFLGIFRGLVEEVLKETSKAGKATGLYKKNLDSFVTALLASNSAQDLNNKLVRQEIQDRGAATQALKSYNAELAATTQRGAQTTMVGSYLRGQPKFGPEPAPGFDPVAGAVKATLLILVAVATPNAGVVNVGLVNVLLVNVCVCVKYTSPGESQNTADPLLVKYFPAPVSPLTTIPLPVNSKLSPDTISSIFFEIALTINGKRSAI